MLGAIFVLCILVYLSFTLHRYFKAKNVKRELNEAYSDENLKKMDYDNAPYDETPIEVMEEEIVESDEDKKVVAPTKGEQVEDKKERKIIDDD